MLTETLNLGREADKRGALVGAWAGALHGFSGIPDSWKSGLVNGREIRLRGEALAKRKKGLAGRDLLEMELGLTQKEAEERRKYLPKEARKSAKQSPVLEDLWLEEEAESEPVPKAALGDPPGHLAKDEKKCWRELISKAPYG